MAFTRGDEGDQALVGAVLIAEAMDGIRVLRDFAIGMSKGSRRG